MHSRGTDARSLTIELTAAINAHAVDAALAFFAEHAVVHVPDQQPTMHRGKDQIRAWLQDDAAHNISVALDQLQEAGDAVTARAKVANDPLREAGIGSVTGQLEIVVQQGRITSFTFATR
jgi:ketosteroid isomerase-like protein